MYYIAGREYRCDRAGGRGKTPAKGNQREAEPQASSGTVRKQRHDGLVTQQADTRETGGQ